jgi:hypothetical protein
MRYWERLSRTIFRFAAQPLLRKISSKTIEVVLKDSLQLLDEEITGEIRQFIVEKQTPEGGFKDRAGKQDLYYSLFGYFIAEAFSVTKVFGPLKSFVKKEITSKSLSGVHLYCGAILYSKLFAPDEISLMLKKKVGKALSGSNRNFEYTSFMGFLALYYLEDYVSLFKLIKSLNHSISTSAHPHISTSTPCPVLAAFSVLQTISGKKDPLTEERLKKFYHENGGFVAVKNAPCEDLLSTGVALYALHFLDADIRLIKPQSLSFVDDLYDNGGFRATQTDFETDVEYTFYGLLALGSLK